MRAIPTPRDPGRPPEPDLAMAELISIYRRRFGSAPSAPETRLGREKALRRILRTWPGFEAVRARDVTAEAVWTWAGRLRAKGTGFRPPGSRGPARKGASASAVNQAVAALQHLLEIARETGAIASNPAAGRPPAGFGRLRIPAGPKRVHLPPQEAVRRIFEEIERPQAGLPARIFEAQRGQRADLGEFCRFLGYSGARVGEARRAVWGDDRGTYLIVHGTKSVQSRDRVVPMNPALRGSWTGSGCGGPRRRSAGGIRFPGRATGSCGLRRRRRPSTGLARPPGSRG